MFPGVVSCAEIQLCIMCFGIFPCSATVNGNGTAHAGYPTEAHAASAAAPTLVKETKVKASVF